MNVDDPVLPAAPHLLGPGAEDLLGAAVRAGGGALRHARLVQVQYRPGHDLVARYEARVSWRGAPERDETLLAGLTARGLFPGTLPVEAGYLTAGVWRYPFDPSLIGLEEAVTPAPLERLVGRFTGPLVDVEVKAYRPVNRAAIRATGSDGEVYVKVVRPAHAEAVVERHESVAAHGLPAPEVLHVDEEHGLVVLAALPGTSLRHRYMSGIEGWPAPSEHLALLERLAALPSPGGRPPDPIGDAPAHAAAIRAVLPSQAGRLDRIAAQLESGPPPSGELVTAHGDYYEAQLMVTGDRITGLLDLDDVGEAHPLHDPATLLAHLQLLRPCSAAHRRRLVGHRLRLRSTLTQGLPLQQLDLMAAAVMVGLATGPFRAQSTSWRGEVRRRLLMAERLAARGGAHSS